MVSFQEFLGTFYFGNTGQDYLAALGILIGAFVLFKFFDSLIVVLLKKASKKTRITWDDLAIDFISAINWQFYAYVSLYIASLTLVLPSLLERALRVILIIFVFYYTAQGLSRVVDHFTKKQIKKRKASENIQNTSMIRVFGTLFKIVIYVVALMMILTNLGIEITPLIASLGVGGIAIAIALQSVLADLFSAFAIYFDKPFKEGDFIVLDSDMGTVEHIGIKTTRIKTLQGQELVISNSELTSTRINNYQKMQERRVAFSFGVEYSTPPRKLRKINKMVEKIIKEVKDARLDRVHFKAFGDFSLNYEVVYYVKNSDYRKYMDSQEKINLGLVEAFEKEKIVFAFPTQTIHVNSFKKK